MIKFKGKYINILGMLKKVVSVLNFFIGIKDIDCAAALFLVV